MLSTLLDRVANLLEKDFLLGSLLPTLVLMATITGTLGWTLGYGALWGWFTSLAVLTQTLATTTTALAAIIFAYLVNGMRPAILAAWSGTSTTWFLRPFYELGEIWHQCQYQVIETRTAETEWPALLQELREGVKTQVEEPKATPSLPAPQRSQDWLGSILAALPTPFAKRAAGADRPEVEEDPASLGAGEDSHGHGAAAHDPEKLPEIDPDSKTKLLGTIKSLGSKTTASEARKAINNLVETYEKYEEDSLTESYRELQTFLQRRADQERGEKRYFLSLLDRSYHTYGTIRATELGNVIAAYEGYGYIRYRMESEIFWTRLQPLLPDTSKSQLQDSQILLHFTAALASFSLLYGVLAVTVGPWLWSNGWFWAAMGIAGFAGGAFLYRRTVGAARQYGEAVRSSFDLHRLDLLRALHRPNPQNLEVEREEWRRLSQLIVYGETQSTLELVVDEGHRK